MICPEAPGASLQLDNLKIGEECVDALWYEKLAGQNPGDVIDELEVYRRWPALT